MPRVEFWHRLLPRDEGFQEGSGCQHFQIKGQGPGQRECIRRDGIEEVRNRIKS